MASRIGTDHSLLPTFCLLISLQHFIIQIIRLLTSLLPLQLLK